MNDITIDMRKMISIESENQMRLSHWLFLLFWFIKPFYFWESGTMQIADFIFVLSFLMWIIDRRGLFSIDRPHLYFILFVLGTITVNSIQSVLNADNVFLISSLYYLYNTFMVLIISEFKNNKAFLKGLLKISYINIISQLVILAIDQGRFYYDTPRYMGTLNDPNQFAFFIFTSFLLIYVLTMHFQSQGIQLKMSLVFLVFILSFYLIARSSSTGMLLGISSFVAFTIVFYIFRKRTPLFTLYKILFFVVLFGIVIYFIIVGFDIDSINAQTDLVRRLLYKFNKVDASGFQALIEERGLDKLYNYPIYNILGAGDGLYGRFVESTMEIHSTFPGVLFYYGIVPFSLLIAWMWSMLQGTSYSIAPVYLAMLIESLTLANQRQPVFWMIIVLCGLTSSQNVDIGRTGVRVSL